MQTIDSQVVNVLTYPAKRRNQFVDAIFYDIDSLTAEEQGELSPLVDREGTIIVVSPRTAGRPIRHYKNALRFMIAEGDAIRALAAAGVGSSVLGAAALARNVADHYDIDVAAVVTGYGISDVAAEALGGWYFYGKVDQFRHAVELMVENWLTTLPEPTRNDKERGFAAPIDSRFVLPGNSDIGTLYDILAASRNLRLLVGHSKGNLLISFALRHFARELGNIHHPHYDNLAVVTLGAVVNLRAEFQRRRQFLGQWDLLGRINSDLDAPHEVVPRVGHHLNPRFPLHMSVGDILSVVPLPA